MVGKVLDLQIINKNGDLENGRPEFWKGAHVYGHKYESLGICLIGKGDFDKKQFNTLKELLISPWKKKISFCKIIRHKDFKNTKNLPKTLMFFRENARII